MYQIRSFWPLVNMKAYIQKKEEIKDFLKIAEEKTRIFKKEEMKEELKNKELTDEQKNTIKERYSQEVYSILKHMDQYIHCLKIDEEKCPQYRDILGTENTRGFYKTWQEEKNPKSAYSDASLRPDARKVGE